MARVFSLTGSLPAGLTFSASTGGIAGTPTQAGTFGSLSIAVIDDDAGNATLGAWFRAG